MNKADTRLLINKELTRIGIPLEHEHASYFRDGYLFAQKQALTIPVVSNNEVAVCDICENDKGLETYTLCHRCWDVANHH